MKRHRRQHNNEPLQTAARTARKQCSRVLRRRFYRARDIWHGNGHSGKIGKVAWRASLRWRNKQPFYGIMVAADGGGGGRAGIDNGKMVKTSSKQTHVFLPAIFTGSRQSTWQTEAAWQSITWHLLLSCCACLHLACLCAASCRTLTDSGANATAIALHRRHIITT